MNYVAINIIAGLVFVYLTYGLVAVFLQEILAICLAIRSKILERIVVSLLEGNTVSKKMANPIYTIKHLFGKKDLLEDSKVSACFYAHPLIKNTVAGHRYKKTAIMPAHGFSTVVVDLLKGPDDKGHESRRISESIACGTIHPEINPPVSRRQHGIEDMHYRMFYRRDNGPAKKEVLVLNGVTQAFLEEAWVESGADVKKFRHRLDQWFEDAMAAATTYYKRYTRISLFLIGFLMAIVFNINSIGLINKLNIQLPAQPVANVEQVSHTVKTVDLRSMDILTGINWHQPAGRNHFLGGFLCFHCNKLEADVWAGWLLTALGIVFFAPLWYKLLQPFMKWLRQHINIGHGLLQPALSPGFRYSPAQEHSSYPSVASTPSINKYELVSGETP